MIDKSVVGKEYPEVEFEIEKGKIREFAKAIGDKNPVYYSEDAAKEEGYESLAIPPTFPTIFGIAGGLAAVLGSLKINMAKLLHGGQEYEYLNPVKVGDVIKGKTKIIDLFDKPGKAGVMDFLVMETTYVNQNGQEVLRDKCTLVIRR